MEDKVSKSNVANLHRVTDWLYRGGQPNEVGLQELYDLGVRTVVSFRWREQVTDWERKACERIGLKFFSIPLTYTVVPKADHIDRFFKMLDDEQLRPLFVHCYHGSDRTGLMVGIYRIAKEGWTVKDAYLEMKSCGFHRFRVRPFKWCLWQYYKKFKRSSAAIASEPQVIERKQRRFLRLG